MEKARYGSAVTATLAGVLDRLHRARPIGELGPSDRLDGARCLVTGGNGGLGRAVAVELARRGGEVLIAGRTLDEKARAAVARESGNPLVTLEHLDLAKLESVAGFCARRREERRPFQVVVINAGVVPGRSRRTADGLEESFQVNFLANVLLLEQLLADGSIAPRASDAAAPRIVFVSSESHRSSPPIDWSTFGTFQPYGVKGSVAEYGRVKLLLTTYAVDLARRLDGKARPEVAVHALCPGAVRTRIGREAPWWSQPALQVTMRLFFKSPAKGAEPVVFLCCARSLEGRTGLYLHGMVEKPPSELAADAENGRRLTDASLRLLEDRGYRTRQRAAATA